MSEKEREIRILLVEDDADHAELAYRVFDKCGIRDEVQTAKDGEEALAVIFGTGAHAGRGIARSLKLILLDLNLPRISGQEILEMLFADVRTRSIAVAVLTVSGARLEQLQKEPQKEQSPIKAYLRKPLEFHAFLNLYRESVGEFTPPSK